MKHVVFFAAPVGFFEKCSLTMKDNGKLFMSQEDYYKILDIKIDNKRNRTLYDFLSSRNLSLDDHRVCIVFVVLKLHIVSCWWLRGNDFSWAVLKKGHRYYRIHKYSIAMQYCMPQFWRKIPKLPIFSQKWPDIAYLFMHIHVLQLMVEGSAISMKLFQYLRLYYMYSMIPTYFPAWQFIITFSLLRYVI